jgi:hypothetical protein
MNFAELVRPEAPHLSTALGYEPNYSVARLVFSIRYPSLQYPLCRSVLPVCYPFVTQKCKSNRTAVNSLLPMRYLIIVSCVRDELGQE